MKTKLFNFILSDSFFKLLWLAAFIILLLASLHCTPEIECDYEYRFANTEEMTTVKDCFTWTAENIKYKEMGDTVRTPGEAYIERTGDCKTRALMTAYWLYSKLNIDSELIGVDDLIKHTGHVILKINNNYYEPANASDENINFMIGTRYKITDVLSYCQAVWEAQDCHCFFTYE